MSPTGTPERALPGNLAAGVLVARLFFRLTLGRRRTLWLGLVLLVPVALSLWWRFFEGGLGMVLSGAAAVFLAAALIVGSRREYRV